MSALQRRRGAVWFRAWVGAAALAGLTACGGGGSDDGDGSTGGYYAVQGLRSSSSAIYTACIDNIEFVDPTTDKGHAITASLVNYYGLSNWVAYAGTGQSCADKYPFANATITVAFYNQTVAGTPAGSGSTGSTGSGGSTSTGSTGGGTSSGGGAQRGFITWNGSVNGEVVLDANDERFRFYADSRCIYSDNTQTEYGNFCLPSSGTTVVFQGTAYTVSRVRSTTNQCIAGLITSDGYFADLFTGSGGIQQISTSNKQPVGC